MFIDSTLQLVTQNFWVILLLYWILMIKPHRLLVVVSIVIALLLSFSLINEPEAFIPWLDKLLSSIHFLPASEQFDVAETSMGEIHKAYVMGFYWGLAILSICFMVFVPVRRLLRSEPES